MKTAKHSLLIVDDEPDLIDSVKDLLRYDYRVLGATRAAEGLKIMEREPIQIVMSDQRMPEMTGVEFLRRLRDSYPDTVRLLFTAYADLKAVTDAINQGNVFRYITKPWEPHELQSVLKQAADYYELLAERRRLLNELREKNARLEEANVELRHANELKKAFIKVASHELRTPLTIVLGLSELARRAPDVGHPLSHWLERIHMGSMRLNERIDLMIKLLLAEQFEKPLEPHPASLSNIVRAAASDIAVFVQQRQQVLEVDAPAELGDVVFQLLVNAVKFTPDGGTIGVSARRLDDGGAEISVRDTGVGIDPASLARVFDPFFTRFDVSRHSSGVCEFDRRGLGLGLSLVKAFVEMHGGRVRVESAVGQGSAFTIVLPAIPGPLARDD
jgi:signal transduction histidine kinase